MTQRVIVDLVVATDARRVAVTVLLSPDDTGRVFTGPDRDTARLQSAVTPFIASARRASERRNGRPPGTHADRHVNVHRVIVDLGTAAKSAVTVCVLLRPNEAGHVFAAPDRNTALLQSAISPFLSRARRDAVRHSPRRPADASRPKRDRARPRAIRAWAEANGHKLPRRGRIPNSVVAAYESELAGQRHESQPADQVEASSAG